MAAEKYDPEADDADDGTSQVKCVLATTRNCSARFIDDDKMDSPVQSITRTIFATRCSHQSFRNSVPIVRYSEVPLPHLEFTPLTISDIIFDLKPRQLVASYLVVQL